MSTNGSGVDVDVVVVGAGMAGRYALHRLRGRGISAVALETADDVGGTWYWNRYPGARCDVMSQDYSYSFDPELDAEWEWSEKYATQPEILRYLQHVADRFDLRRDIRFETSVESASWDDEHRTWAIATSAGDTVRCRWYIMATGCLSAPKDPDIEGADAFGGDVYFTSRWPHGGVDLTGKRVAVIGTGSSAIQSIPIMAQQAAELTVFQRDDFDADALERRQRLLVVGAVDLLKVGVDACEHVVNDRLVLGRQAIEAFLVDGDEGHRVDERHGRAVFDLGVPLEHQRAHGRRGDHIEQARLQTRQDIGDR